MDSKDIFPVHQGYLTKSPPEHGFTGRMKRWLKRWFVLRADKSLEYYDERQGRLLNTIDLSMCKCLDGNLDHKRFQNVFSIKIKGTTEVGKGVDRNYYLVADSPYEMDMWVKEICKICDFQKLIHATGLSPKNHKKHPRKEVYEKTSGKAAPIKEYPLAFGQEKMQDRERPDSGIHMPSNENNDIVKRSYDLVPPPRELSAKMSGDSNEQPNYDQQSNYDMVPPASHVIQPKYDVPPAHFGLQPNYDIVPPHSGYGDSGQQPNYDIVPPHSAFGDSGQQPNYDIVPPHSGYGDSGQQPNYDIVPPHSGYNDFGQQPNYDVVPPHSGYSDSEQQPNYDIVPPTSHVSKHDVPPANHGPSHVGYDDQQPYYDAVPPQQTRVVCPLDPMYTQEHIQNRDSRLSSSAYDDVPPPRPIESSGNITQGEIYDHVPQHHHHDDNPHLVALVANAAAHHMEPEQPTYDVPPDMFLPNAAAHHMEPEQQTYDVPPAILPRTNNAYVNLHIGGDLYNKPLPHISGAHADERDSGTVADFTCESTYDVLPTCNYTQSPQDNYPPKIDRSSKPGSAPLLDRSSKPPAKEYVNLPKSSTFREPTRPIHLKSNLQRSQSAVGDSEVDGYLYMESPKRTHSSSRFSKKDFIAMEPSSFEEEDEEKRDEYEFMHAPAWAAADAEYENYEPQPATEGQSHDRTSDYYENYGPADLKQPPNAPPRPLKGQYQDIDIARRQPEALPPAIQPRTNYTTIDLERTRGFRQTCEQSCKRH